MAMKLDEFLALKQGDQTVMQYVGKFNHLSQYASEQVNTDAKKKRWFMRGLSTKLQTMMTTCTNVTYHEAVNIAIALEEKYRQHKEIKKKKSVSSGSFGGNQKRQDNLSSSKSLSSAVVASQATIKCPSCHNLPEPTTDKCSWCPCSNTLGS